MNARGRFGFGGLFVAVGVAAWTWLLWAYEPVGRSSAHLPSVMGFQLPPEFWLAAGRNLRLSALVLGVGGLLIMARGWRPGAWLALALGAAWAGADFGLDVTDVDSLVTVVVAGLAVAAAAAAIIAACARRSETAGAGRAWWLLVYAGMAVGVATPGYRIDGVGTPLGNWLIFAMVLASALVAGGAVNPGGPPTTGRRLAAVLVALAIALYLPVAFGWGPAAGPFGESPFWWRETMVASARLYLPLVAAAAIAMTGAWSGRRAVVAVPVAVLALLPASLARTVPPLLWLLPVVGRGFPLDETDGHRYLPGQLIAGVVLGVSAWVLARRAPVLFGPAVKSTEASRSAGTRRATTAVGLALAIAGVASWAVAEAVVAPAARAVDHGQPISIHIIAPLIGWAANLRWGSIVLAWVGLLLAARVRRRARWLTAGVLVWFAADLAIAAIGVRGWLAAGVCAVVVGVGLFVVALMRATVEAVPPGSVGFAAAAAGAGIQLMAVKAWMPQYLPSWAFQLGLAVSLLLVVAAVAHTLTAQLAMRPGPIVGAVVVAAAGFAGAAWHYVVARQETERADLSMQLTLAAAVAVAATACALSSAGTLRRRWWATTGAVALVAIGALPLFGAAAILALVPQDLAFGLDGLLGITGEWYSDPVAGAILGGSVALLALWPSSLSIPDSPLTTEAPPSSEPVVPPARRAPQAVPGVPEVLSWPPDQDAVPAR